jgi:hypothetical protein
MEPNNIVVGAKYTNPLFPTFVYLGCSETDMNKVELRKFLVIISGGENVYDSVGRIVLRIIGNPMSDNYWSQFHTWDEPATDSIKA